MATFMRVRKLLRNKVVYTLSMMKSLFSTHEIAYNYYNNGTL